MTAEVVTAVAVAFAVVTGANDGGALIAPGLRVPILNVPISLAVLAGATVALPLLAGTAVASTLLRSIVPPGDAGRTAVVTGFVVAVVVVAVLTRVGRPTSLTLAVIGGLTGAGFGFAVPVDTGVVGRVLAIGLAAPAVGMLLALLASSWWRPARGVRYLTAVRRAHVVAYVTQCVAYGANDGQKMLVLFMIAGTGDSLEWWSYPVVAIAFALGAVLGLPRVARTVGTGILNVRPTHAVTAEMSAAVAVLGSSALGAPVSMTQAVTGGLLGAGVHQSYRRIRWEVVRNLVAAWMITLPVSAGLGALVGIVLS